MRCDAEVLSEASKTLCTGFKWGEVGKGTLTAVLTVTGAQGVLPHLSCANRWSSFTNVRAGTKTTGGCGFLSGEMHRIESFPERG